MKKSPIEDKNKTKGKHSSETQKAILDAQFFLWLRLAFLSTVVRK